MGWAFIILGLVLVGIGSFITLYGRELLSAKPTVTTTHSERLLSPPQERLLGLLFKCQRDLASSKLVIGRNGLLFFEDPERRKTSKVSFLTEMYGSKEGDETKAAEFVSLMESLPFEYVRFHAEARFDNPFVVSVTQAGVKYLRDYK